MEIDSEQMITAMTAAKSKGFVSVDAFMYHVNKKPETTPQPVIMDGIRFWNRSEIDNWTPTFNKRGRKSTSEGVESHG